MSAILTGRTRARRPARLACGQRDVLWTTHAGGADLLWPGGPRLDGMTRDWYAWHDQYTDPASPLSRRLAEVRTHVGAALDAARPGPLRAVSLCAGQGRDLIPVLATHPRGGDVTARLVELDPRNVEVARAAVARAGGRGGGGCAPVPRYAPPAAERGDDVRVHRAADRRRRPLTGHGGRIAAVGVTGDARPGRTYGRGRAGQPPKPESAGREMSGFSNSSTLTSLNVITRTFFTNRAGRYMSHTHASCISTSK